MSGTSLSEGVEDPGPGRELGRLGTGGGDVLRDRLSSRGRLAALIVVGDANRSPSGACPRSSLQVPLEGRVCHREDARHAPARSS